MRLLGTGIFLLGTSGAVNAAPIFTNTAVVTSPANVAAFEGISGSLLNYTEDGIVVSADDFQWGGYPNVHYGSGGNIEWVTISLASGGVINALDFLLGDGWSAFNGSSTNLIWETFSGSASTGFGDLVLTTNSTVGWTDSIGFTSLRVAAHYQNINAFGDYQAIALDNLRIGAGSVPEPVSLILFSLGLAGLGFRHRKLNKN